MKPEFSKPCFKSAVNSKEPEPDSEPPLIKSTDEWENSDKVVSVERGNKLSSFFNNKGVSFGEYLLITNLSFISFLVGYSILLPLGCIVHYYLGYALLGVSVIYTLVCFISGINNELKFRSNNRR